MDITGNITDELSIIAAYAYTDTETFKNNGAPFPPVNRPIGNVPLHTSRIWLAYEFAEDTPFKGLGLGIGQRYVGSRETLSNDVELPSYQTFDAGIWYSYEFKNSHRIKAQLNFDNITGEEFIQRASAQSLAHPGEPFSVRGSIKYEF